jgi:hypothetical protein
MNKIGLVLSLVCFSACGAFGQSANAGHAASSDTTKAATVVPTPAPASVAKTVPKELTDGLAKVEALNNAISDLKQQAGITALENELQKNVQALFALAAKDGFHFENAINNFVADPPKLDSKAAPAVAPKSKP